jgi:precorrin-3B synthase
MPAADGLLVRVRPVFGRIDAGAARQVAAAAAHGNGLIDLTQRGNLQFRGFDLGSAASFAGIVGGLGVDQPVGTPGLMVSPLLGVDPAAAPEAGALAREIAGIVAGVTGLEGPAEKFAVSFDAGGVIGLGSVGADIAIRTAAIGAVGTGWVVDDEVCSAGDLVAVVRRRLEACAPALRAGRRPERMGMARAATVPPLGFVAYTADRGAFGLGLVFGAMNANLLRLLADLAASFGDGVLRFTPWRAVVIAGVTQEAAVRLADAAAAEGMIVAGPDWRFGVQACVGAPFCAAAGRATRADALALGDTGRGVHVSGCAKGCAHPGPAEVTLVGRDGRYDLVRNGRAGDTPVRRGLDLAAVRAELTMKVPA